MPSWIDIHAHLDRLTAGDLETVIAEASEAGVSTILSTATDLASSDTVITHCEKSRSIFGAVGICPFDAPGLPDSWVETLRAKAAHRRVIAIGEIGIDASNPKYPPLEIQLPVFEKQLAIAVDLDLPAVIHSRGAESRAADICREHGVRKAVFHCFTGDNAALDRILEYGYHVSFSGIITFSSKVLDQAASIPIDRLFIETDSPYLAPVPHRGSINTPARVGITGGALASARKIDTEVLQKHISDNFSRLFSITPDERAEQP